MALAAIKSDAASSAPIAENDQYTELMQDMMQRLDKDLKNLFSDVGIETSNYDKDVVRSLGHISSSRQPAHQGLLHPENSGTATHDLSDRPARAAARAFPGRQLAEKAPPSLPRPPVRAEVRGPDHKVQQRDVRPLPALVPLSPCAALCQG